ncbi:hypothetical protein DYB28_007591, partial [Aphanomyces astaci]
EFKGGHASVEHDVVGIAYSITTSRTSVYFWFHSTVRLDVANQSLLALLQHVRESHVQTVIRLPGVDKSYCECIHDSKSAAHWNRENGYELHVLDAAVPVKATALGASWNVDGETFEMDSANSSDAASILSLASVGYDPAYILELLKHPIFSQLMRVVRLTSTKRAVSWSLVHSDFSIGLLGTVPEYRRKGLVGLALSSTVEAYRATGMTNDNARFGVQPHCFVHWSNTASQQLMASLGFKPVPNKTFHWMRLHAPTRVPKLYVLREYSAQDYDDDARAVDAAHDPVVGIGFSFISDNQHERFGLHFWLRSTISPSTATQSLSLFLRHATAGMDPHMVGLRAVEHNHYVAIQDIVNRVLWKDTNGCGLYLLDAATPVTSVALGATWQVDGDTFEMDSALPSDAPAILSLSSIEYDEDYIYSLLKHPVFSKFLRVVRVAATKQPVSWALVHNDFSLGLVGTDPAYRRKGLVRLAFGSTIEAYRDAIRVADVDWFGLQQYCFVFSDNVASQRLMASMGFHQVHDKIFHWMGVLV